MEPFCGDSAKWEKWRDRLKLWLQLNKVTDQWTMKCHLLYGGGEEVDRIVKSLPAEKTECPLVLQDPPVFDKMIEALDAHFEGLICRTARRFALYQLRQKQGERFHDFVIRVKEAARKCLWKAPEIEDEHVVDQLVVGAADPRVREKLLRKDYALSEAMEIGASFEAVSVHSRSMAGVWLETTNPRGETDSLRVLRVDSDRGKLNRPYRKEEQENRECFACGRVGHLRNDSKCRAKESECHKCGKKGHFAAYCRSTQRQEAYKRSSTFRSSTRQRKIRRIDEVTSPTRSGRDEAGREDHGAVFHLGDGEEVICQLGGVELKLLVDSGAAHNVISERDWKYLKSAEAATVDEVPGGTRILRAYAAKDPLRIVTSFRARIRAGRSEASDEEFHVVHDGEVSLLSYRTAKRLNLIRIGLDIRSIQPNQHEAFPMFKGIKVRIHIDPKVEPIVQPFRTIPLAYEKEVEAQIRELLAKDIIELVRGPPTWVSPLVVVRKENGQLRLCVDMRAANTAVKRPYYPMPTIDSVLHKLQGARIFSKLDIRSAFHQVELDPSCRHITTFVTKGGCYQYKRLSFGVSAAPELFQQAMDKILAGLDGVVAYMDDLLIFGSDQQEHDRRLEAVLQRLREYEVALNEDKQLISVARVDFLGHKLSAEGVEPQRSKVYAVEMFRAPTNKDEVMSFLGLVVFLQKFCVDLASLSAPLRKLTEKDALFRWGAEEAAAFMKIKEEISKGRCLAYFNPSLSTEVITDASPEGLGAALLQVQPDGQKKVVELASRSLSRLERKYAQTEREALGIMWALERFQIYLAGRHFTLYTDCKPLIYLFRPLSKPSARLERWLLRVQAFDFEVKHLSGKNNIADSLSRLSVRREPPESATEAAIHLLAADRAPKTIKVEELERESAADDEMKWVKRHLESDAWTTEDEGAPPRRTATTYQTLKGELCVVGELLLRGDRLVIPASLRTRTLKIAHEGHPGIQWMKRRLRSKVWWPEIDGDTEKFVKLCQECLLVVPAGRPEPMKRFLMPSEPWEQLAGDFLGPLPNGEYIFVVVDYYSRWLEVFLTKSTTSKVVVQALKESFARFGNPRSIQMDNAPNLISQEIIDFLDERDVNLLCSTPYWPQRQGEVERQNRSLLKRLQIGAHLNQPISETILEYLTLYRSSPHATTGRSPAEMMFGGRRIRDKLPMLSTGHLDDEGAREMDARNKEIGRQYADWRRKATTSTIKPRDVVVVVDPNPTNKLSTKYGSERHIVLTRSGAEVVLQSLDTDKVIRRNVAHTKRAPEPTENVEDKQAEGHETPLPGGNDVSQEEQPAPDSRAREAAAEGEERADQEKEGEGTQLKRTRKPNRKYDDYVLGRVAE